MASIASGTPMPSRHIGGRAIRFAARTGELFSRVTRSPPRLPSWLADFLLTGASMENGKSVRELGMTYRPIRESIRDSIGWFRDEGLFEGPEAPAARQLEVMAPVRSEEHTSELQSQSNLVCRLLLEKKKKKIIQHIMSKPSCQLVYES